MMQFKIRNIDVFQLSAIQKWCGKNNVMLLPSRRASVLDKKKLYTVRLIQENIKYVPRLDVHENKQIPANYFENSLAGKELLFNEFEALFLKVKKARLIFTTMCKRNCKGCYMRNWSGKEPEFKTYEQLNEYDEIYITGGEPMLYPLELINTIKIIRKNSKAKIYLYTALPSPLEYFNKVLELVDGITLTLHQVKDVDLFRSLKLGEQVFPKKSMRLHIFPIMKVKAEDWVVRHKVWLKDAPLPAGEELIKLY